ncbi:MAG TPA: hypothetical protein VMD99_03345 [Terriglobales bacterium]|nr:hypothetical protein [Terriglobales bacterium]
MKFAEKYEILEMLTSGRVSTFLARDRATQDQVVVYTFDCAGTGSSELSTASIIAKFCSIAPNPPGIIIKAGFDAASSSAFLTTKMPDAAALKDWTSKYHGFAQPAAKPSAAPVSRPVSDATAEISASELKAVLAQGRSHPVADKPVADQGESTAAFSAGPPSQTAPPSGGEFTRLFQEANAFEPLRSSRSPAQSPPASKPGDATDAMLGKLSSTPYQTERKSPPPPISTKPEPTLTGAGSSPGSFTREFLGLSKDDASLTPGRTPVDSPTPSKNRPGSFTREFLAASQSPAGSSNQPAGGLKEPTPPSTAFGSAFGPASEKPVSEKSGSFAGDSRDSDSRKAAGGEFTQFFGSPFDQPEPAQRSFEIPDLATSAPPAQQAGDFTRMFGRDDIPSPEASSAAPTGHDQRPLPGSFTQLFSQEDPAKGGAQLGSSILDTSPDLGRSAPRQSGLRPSPSDPVFPTSPPVPARPLATPPADVFSPRPSAPMPPASTPPPAAPVIERPFSGRSHANDPNANDPKDATDIFRVRGADAPPVEEIPSGPSEFTVFLSRSQIGASLPPDPSLPAGAGAVGQPGAFAPPPIPQPPPFQFTPPPPPPAPPAIKYSAPAPPPLPKPQLPAAPPKAASYWPLITVLTALFFIAAMLIMYFLLTKH